MRPLRDVATLLVLDVFKICLIVYLARAICRLPAGGAQGALQFLILLVLAVAFSRLVVCLIDQSRQLHILVTRVDGP